MSPLQAIAFFPIAKLMIRAVEATNSTEQLKRTYTARYRYVSRLASSPLSNRGRDPSSSFTSLYFHRNAYNAPHATPDDIFRNLYGYACGSKGLNRECSRSEEGGTGACLFGSKKRHYVLDIYNDLLPMVISVFKFHSFSKTGC